MQDEWGVPFAGIPVTFAVTAGNGTLSVTSVETDAHGRAQTTFTVGSDVGLNTISVSALEIQQSLSFTAVSESIQFDLSIPADISLIHIPLKVTHVDGVANPIESISDLYAALGADAVNFLITRDSQAQEWLSYFGPTHTRGRASDKVLTDDTGIIVGLTAPVSVQLSGSPLGTDGNSPISLRPGLNLVGLPLRDERIVRVSDLLALDGIGGNVPVIILTDGRKFQLVGRAGDPGDIAITGGQGFIMNASQAAQVTISGAGWTNTSGSAAAPLIALKGIAVTDTTPVLGLRGVVVDERSWLNRRGLARHRQEPVNRQSGHGADHR